MSILFKKSDDIKLKKGAIFGKSDGDRVGQIVMIILDDFTRRRHSYIDRI